MPLVLTFGVLIAAFAYWSRAHLQFFLRFHRIGVFYSMAVVMAAGAGFALLTFAPEVRSTILSNDERHELLESTAVLLPVAGIAFYLLVLFAAFYATIPQAWGGGRPDHRNLWVSGEALPILNICNKQVTSNGFEEPKGVSLPDVWVLHETHEKVTIWRDSCPTLELPKLWVRAEYWPQ